MKLEKNNNNGWFELVIHLDGDAWKKYLTKAEESLISTIDLKGFRKGHVPKEIAKQHISNQHIQNKAKDLFIDEKNNVFIDELKKNDIISKPSLMVSKISDDEIELVLKAALAPIIKIGDLTKIKLEFKKVDLTDEELERELEHFKKQHFVVKKPSTRETIENNDFANIDFSGTIDGEKFEGGEAKNYELKIGSKSFIDNFEEQLIGMKIGEERTIKVRFPKVYPVEKLADKEAVFLVKLNSILTNSNLGESETLEKVKQFGYDKFDDLIVALKATLIERKNEETRAEYFAKYVVEILKLEDTKIEINEQVILDEANVEFENFANDLNKQGLNIEQYLKLVNKTKEDFIKNEMYSRAKKAIEQRLIFTQLVKHFNITLEEKDYDEEYENIAKLQKLEVDKIKQQLKKEILRNPILLKKLLIKITN